MGEQEEENINALAISVFFFLPGITFTMGKKGEACRGLSSTGKVLANW